MRTIGALIDWLLRNFLRLAIIIIIAFVVLGFGLQTCEGDTGKPPGKVDDTIYLVKTTSRLYYTDNYTWQGDTLILHGFWVKEGNKWRQFDRDLPMPRKSYGKVEVVRR